MKYGEIRAFGGAARLPDSVALHPGYGTVARINGRMPYMVRPTACPHPSNVPHRAMVIIEYPGFTKTIGELMDDEDYRALQNALVENPERGDLIPGTGGLRKIRWSLAGRGKQGGARIIYYWWTRASRLYLLLAYPKNVQDNLTPTQAKRLAEAIHRELDDGRKTIR